MVGFHRISSDMFLFATTPNADLHTAALCAFGEAHERLETALTFDGVRAYLHDVGWFTRTSDEELERSLKQLVGWKLVDTIQNHGATYATAEEYERKNLQYSLTKKGEAAFEGYRRALGVLASTGALQTAVLDAIADRLDELHRCQLDRTVSNRRVFTTLTELEGHLEALRTNTKQFNAELHRLLRDDTGALKTFLEVKDATIAYLDEFVTNLDQRHQSIRDAVQSVEQEGLTLLRQRALFGAELPAIGGETQAATWHEHRTARWEGLRAWFVGTDASPARIEELRDIARRAIVFLFRMLERISESRRRSSSTVADFRALARWFAVAPTEADAHRLWSTAFGLGPARHAHLTSDAIEQATPATTWADAPTVPVSPLLRAIGRSEQFGRTANVRNVRALRERRRAVARKEREELEAAWNRLATNGSVRLSSLRKLDHPTFERFLDLLGRALSARPDPQGRRRAVSADGRVELLLRPPVDATTARVRTPHGRFTGPDYVIDIHIKGTSGLSIGEASEWPT